VIPSLRAAARHANRTNEVLPLLGRNGRDEDKASGDDLVVEMNDMYCSSGSQESPPSSADEGRTRQAGSSLRTSRGVHPQPSRATAPPRLAAGGEGL